MKLLVAQVMFLAAASAVTVYRSEDSTGAATTGAGADSLTMESQQGRTRQRGSVTHADTLEGQDGDQTRSSYVARQQKHESQDKKQSGKRHQRKRAEASESSAASQQGQEASESSFVPRQRRQPQHSQATEAQHFSADDGQQFFFQSNQQEQGDNEHQFGYSSFIEHQGEEQGAAAGSDIDIKKVAPKSSVQVQMYHQPQQSQPQENQHSQQNQYRHLQLQTQQQTQFNQPGQNHHESTFQSFEHKPTGQYQHSNPQPPQLSQQQLHSLHLNKQQQLELAQLYQKEMAQAKQKNVHKIYSDAAAFKNKPFYQQEHSVPESHGQLGLSAYLSPTFHQPNQASSAKLRQFGASEQQSAFGNFHGFGPIASATDNHANSEIFPPFTPQNIRTRVNSDTPKTPEAAAAAAEAGADETKKIIPETISVSMSPSWKALTENLEIATSDEANAKKNGKVRRPKEVSAHLFSSHNHQLFDSGAAESFKSERFDHEKALRSSTPFGVSHVVSGFDGKPVFPQVGSFPHANSIPQVTEEVKESKREENNIFRLAHSVDLLKSTDTPKPAVSKGPLTFVTGEKIVKIPRTKTVISGGFEIPVLTQEEYNTHFGNYRTEAKAPEKTRPTRLAFDGRSKQVPKQQQHQKSQPQKSQPQKSQAHSFAQFNSVSNSKSVHHQGVVHHQGGQQQKPQQQKQVQLFHQHQPQQQQKQNIHHPQQLFRPSSSPYQNKGNVEVFPSLGFTLASKRNISIVPDRQGKVLPEFDNGHPQQFSVSASYKIDQRNSQVA